MQTLRAWKGVVGREIRSRLLELRLPEGATEEEALAALPAGGAGDADLERVRQIVQASTDRDLAAAVARVEQDVRQLNGAVADLTAQQKRLQEQRDVARDVYFSLLKKTEEARLSAAVANGQEVTVASRAVVAEPRGRSASR